LANKVATQGYVQLTTPTVMGGVPTAYGRPLAEVDGLSSADAAFLGILWAAPIEAGHIYMGQGSNYGATGNSPSRFRFASLRHYGGFLPELDFDVLESIELLDAGDIAPSGDMAALLAEVDTRVKAIVDADCIPITYGGNAGPSSFAVVRAIGEQRGEPVTVVNFDAHHDNFVGDWREEDPRHPQWAETWVHQTLDLPCVDSARYRHVGLRGPLNDRDVFARFAASGVPRENILTSREIRRAREGGFGNWAQAFAEAVASDGNPVWVAIDIDVLGIDSNPDFADEAFGPSAEEVIELVHRIAATCGRQRFAGLSFMAIPPEATSLHLIASNVILYALAGVAAGKSLL
jgi:arginase family enzyme